MNHPTAYQLLERFNEIQTENKSVDEKDESDALTISYMLGAENANERIRALKKRIAELIAVIDDTLHELAVESPLTNAHWAQLKERMERAVGVGEKGKRP